MNIDEDRVPLYLERIISGTIPYCRCPAGMEVVFWLEGWIEVNGHSLKAPYSKSLLRKSTCLSVPQSSIPRLRDLSLWREAMPIQWYQIWKSCQRMVGVVGYGTHFPQSSNDVCS